MDEAPTYVQLRKVAHDQGVNPAGHMCSAMATEPEHAILHLLSPHK